MPEFSSPAETEPPPPSPIRRVLGRRSVLQSPVQWSARPKVSVNPPERAEAHEPTMAYQGFNIEALAGLQAKNLSKLIEILQGLAAGMTSNNPPNSPPAPAPPAQTTEPNIPATAVREEENSILW